MESAGATEAASRGYVAKPPEAFHRLSASHRVFYGLFSALAQVLSAQTAVETIAIWSGNYQQPGEGHGAAVGFHSCIGEKKELCQCQEWVRTADPWCRFFV